MGLGGPHFALTFVEWCLGITLVIGFLAGWLCALCFVLLSTDPCDWFTQCQISATHFVLTSGDLTRDRHGPQSLAYKHRVGSMGSLNDVVSWVGVQADLWTLLSHTFGTLPNWRVLAAQPVESVMSVTNGLRIQILRADASPEAHVDSDGIPLHIVSAWSNQFKWR